MLEYFPSLLGFWRDVGVGHDVDVGVHVRDVGVRVQRPSLLPRDEVAARDVQIGREGSVCFSRFLLPLLL